MERASPLYLPPALRMNKLQGRPKNSCLPCFTAPPSITVPKLFPSKAFVSAFSFLMNGSPLSTTTTLSCRWLLPILYFPFKTHFLSWGCISVVKHLCSMQRAINWMCVCFQKSLLPPVASRMQSYWCLAQSGFSENGD